MTDSTNERRMKEGANALTHDVEGRVDDGRDLVQERLEQHEARQRRAANGIALGCVMRGHTCTKEN